MVYILFLQSQAVLLIFTEIVKNLKMAALISLVKYYKYKIRVSQNNLQAVLYFIFMFDLNCHIYF